MKEKQYIISEEELKELARSSWGLGTSFEEDIKYILKDKTPIQPADGEKIMEIIEQFYSDELTTTEVISQLSNLISNDKVDNFKLQLETITKRFEKKLVGKQKHIDRLAKKLNNDGETAIKFKVTKGIDMHLAIGQTCWDRVKDDIGTEYRIKITKG